MTSFKPNGGRARLWRARSKQRRLQALGKRNSLVEGCVEQMIADSELMMSWTPEVPPEKLFITRSAVLQRSSEAERSIYENRISEYRSARSELVSVIAKR